MIALVRRVFTVLKRFIFPTFYSTHLIMKQ